MPRVSRPVRFALVGAAGFVAPRHLEAIQRTGNALVAALDPHDSVGILDRYFPEARFFTEFERFDRHLEKLRRGGPDERVEWVSVCSPNALHDAHVRLALRLKANALCEKPLVINPWNVDQLAELEQEHGARVFTVLQLRLHPALLALRARLQAAPAREKHAVELSYVTRRGAWYHSSWKGDEQRSGGLTTNLGVHLFDVLGWLFGPLERLEVHLRSRDRAAGYLELERARVRWLLSVRADDLPGPVRAAGRHAWRQLLLDGEEVEFSDGFEGLHVRVYEEALAGRGVGLEDARPSVETTYRLRTAPLEPGTSETRHPALGGAQAPGGGEGHEPRSA